MKTLYYTNIAILSFALTLLGGLLRMFAVHPSILYCGLICCFVILFLGIFPYRVRTKNPFLCEFVTIFFAVVLGVVTWF